MYHPRLSGSHYDMGYKQGTMMRKKGVDLDTLIHLDKFQYQHGNRSIQILKEIFPTVYEEISGLAEGIKYPFDKFGAWLMCMGCCYDPRGCTTFCFKHKDKVIFARNNDLPPFLKKSSQSILYRPENRYAFLGNTSSMINLEEGLNENGLAVGMEFIMPTMIQPGINSVFIVRYLLEKCVNTKEALSAIKNIPIASACSIILVDKSGDLAVVECELEKQIVRTPKDKREFLVAANHFVSDEMREVNSNSLYSSEKRYKTAQLAIKNIEGKDEITYAQKILRGEYGFMCQYHPSLHFETIWSSVFDVTELKVYRAEGDPTKVNFQEDLRGNLLVI